VLFMQELIMAEWVSKLDKGVEVIDDNNFHKFAAEATKFGRGRVPRDWAAQPRGSVARLDIPLIPRTEWAARIKEMEERKNGLKDLILQSGRPNKNQGQTNYCWTNAVVRSMELIALLNGEPYINLSPASVAAPCKNYSNSGGWGGEALKYIVQHGISSSEFWPDNAIDRKYDNEASRANRVLHIIKEWYELGRRRFDQKMSLMLHRLPVPSGYNWMGHEMCGVRPLYLGKDEYGCEDENSWGPTNKRWFTLSESKGTPDDGVAPLATSLAAA
jgi:Papain family cysteine protease